jgi:hypothetical protein
MTKLNDLLDRVEDKKSFIEFVRELADEKERAKKIEDENPNAYIIDGALGWKEEKEKLKKNPH